MLRPMRPSVLLCLAVAGCSPSVSNASSREVVSPVTEQNVWVIECEVHPDACEKEAVRICGSEHRRTLEGGRESWYADDEEPFAPQLSPKERKNYKRVGWTIACN